MVQARHRTKAQHWDFRPPGKHTLVALTQGKTQSRLPVSYQVVNDLGMFPLSVGQRGSPERFVSVKILQAEMKHLFDSSV